MPACDISEIGRADTSERAGRGGDGTAGSAAFDALDSRGSPFGHNRAYIRKPLQPNNCGTPDTFKNCRVIASASNGPRKPEVLIEVLEGTGAAPAGLMNDPLPDSSRLMLGPVLLPSLHPPIDALHAEDELQRALKDTVQQRVEALQQQMTKLKQLSQRLQELQRKTDLQAADQTEIEMLRQEIDSVRHDDPGSLSRLSPPGPNP